MSYEHRNRPRRVSVVEYRSVESKGLWFDIPYGDLEFFPLPHARDKTKKDLPLVLFWLRILDFIFRGSRYLASITNGISLV